MSFILKNGKPVGIGKNVKVTLIESDMREKRKALYDDSYERVEIFDLDSAEFLFEAKKDPVTFTYTMWRLFKEDTKRATEKVCDLAIRGNARDVAKTLELMLFDASPKINAFCLNFIISQLSHYIEHDPKLVKSALKRMLVADLKTTLRIMKGMYYSSPRTAKDIAKKLMSRTQYLFVKTFIKPVIRKRF